MVVIRIKNGHGEHLATVEAVDQAIAEFLPSSPDELRSVIQRIAPAGNGYTDVHSVSELLIMLASASHQMIPWTPPATEP